MYALILTAHSWIRWILVMIAITTFLRSAYALGRRHTYSISDARLATGFAGALNVQLVLGLSLYVLLSPLVRVGLSDLSAAMASAPLRFFVIEHQVAALVAIGVGHAGLIRARKATDDRIRHWCVFWGAGGCLLMILIAIPWPFLPYGRDLLRM